MKNVFVDSNSIRFFWVIFEGEKKAGVIDSLAIQSIFKIKLVRLLTYIHSKNVNLHSRLFEIR
jgi:hypothetical protein